MEAVVSVGKFGPWNFKRGTGGNAVFADDMSAWVEGLVVGRLGLGHHSSAMRTQWENKKGMGAAKRESTYVLVIISKAHTPNLRKEEATQPVGNPE